MSRLKSHAEEELNRVGLFDEDSDYNGSIGKCVLELITLFASQRHSGASAELTTQLFEKLARFEPLSPISSDPSEWIDRSVESGRPFWQNSRDSRSFSEDGGLTWKRI